MSSVTESNLGLNYGWAYGESGWNTGMDDNLVKLGFTSRNQVKGILSAPPSTPSNGDAYIVGISPTGLFSGNFGKVAIWDRTVWLFLTPKNHEVVYNVANGCDYKYDNGWVLKQEDELSPYVKVKDFTFSTGYTITDQKQCLLNLVDNKYYQWFGALPKVVPDGSAPATAGGIGALLWVDRTDLTLRADWYGEIGNVHYYGLVPDGVTDNSAQLLSLFQTYENLYFPKGTYVLTDDRCVNALRTKAVSTTVKYHPEAKFIGGGKLPYSISNTDHRAQFDYSVKYFDSGDSYSTSKGAQTLALDAVSSASFTGNAVGLYTGAVGASGSTGGIWAANPIAIANAGFAGRVRAVEIDVENNSTSTIDSFGLTIWGGGAYDITQAFKFARSNNVSLYELGGEIAFAKRGLKLTSIGNHPTRSGEHVYALSITDCPKNAITIQPTALNNSAQIYGKSVDGSSAIWRINNDGSTSFPQVTSPKIIADKIELNTHVYTATPLKFGAYYMWYGTGGILRASTSAPATGDDGNPFGVKVSVPTTATSTGYIGQWAADASYMYVCTATNVWKRVALSTW